MPNFPRPQDVNPTHPSLPPYPWPIDAQCVNCSGQIAWRAGVGRHVITHAHGDDLCHPKMHVMAPPGGADKATEVLAAMNDVLEAALAAEKDTGS